MKYVFGINPVTELLKSGKKINEIYILNSKKNKLIEIEKTAKQNNVKINYTDKEFFEKKTGDLNHQGIIALSSDNITPRLNEDELYNIQNEKITLLALDGITDPHNLGAVLRSADLFGVNAVILPKDKSAVVNETVYKTSSGAAFYVPTCTVTNLTRTLEKLKKNGFWIYALDIDNGINLKDEKFPDKCVIVLGSEGKGLKRIVKNACDIILTIPMAGHVDSLNASNACAIVLYEIFNHN